MASGLLALLDDIATLLDDVAAMTKVAARQGAAAADDVAGMTQLAAKKTAGVLGDDLALNAQQVTGVNAVRELPARQREAFVLCHVHDTPPGEAAEALGMNAATFRVHLFRAVRKLRVALGGS